MDIDVGQLVYSVAGRDGGRKFIVIGIIDSSNVLISDGDLRPIEKAKKKKIKHLRVLNKIVLPVSDKIKNDIKVSNSDIRKALADIEENI